MPTTTPISQRTGTALTRIRTRRRLAELAELARQRRLATTARPDPDPENPGDDVQVVTIRIGRYARRRTGGAIRTILISTRCRLCGLTRGEPRWDGSVQVWDNPCGHTDTTKGLLVEADFLELAQAGWGQAALGVTDGIQKRLLPSQATAVATPQPSRGTTPTRDARSNHEVSGHLTVPAAAAAESNGLINEGGELR